MTDDERRALASLRFEWAPTMEDVWTPARYHVPALHEDAAKTVLEGFEDARSSHGPSPIGVVIQGQHGAGKTHMLHWLRERVQQEGGYFFLVELLDHRAFWESILQAMLRGLLRPAHGHPTQLKMLMSDLLPPGRSSRRRLDGLVQAVRSRDSLVGLECQDTARALALYADAKTEDLGWRYLLSADEVDAGELPKWGIQRRRTAAEQTIGELSRLLGLTGPTVIAIDQIDTLIAQSRAATSATNAAGEETRQSLLVAGVADGLMHLRDETRRTLSVVACLPSSWELVRTRAVESVPDRFRLAPLLDTIDDARIGRAVVEQRFAARFHEVGFRPPHPTWPVRESAFDTVGYTPRQLLVQIDAHVRRCLRDGEVRELTALDGGVNQEVTEVPPPPTQLLIDWSALDDRFVALRKDADVVKAFDPATEDSVVPSLLSAGIEAWIRERGIEGRAYVQDPPPGVKSPIHARLRCVLDEATEDEAHWAFRAIGSDNARAVITRLRNACNAAGLDKDVPRRRLILLRSTPRPSGETTRRQFKAFTGAGGTCLPLIADDLRTFAALRQMLAEGHPHLSAWLAERRPAGGTELLSAALVDATAGPGPPEADGRSGDVSTVPLGFMADNAQPFTMSLASLRRHVAVLAGSGSGKTVLLRRLIESCALRGVSSIVLDSNNDLARLGDRWPAPPSEWDTGDEAMAADYLRQTDVVIWTPGRQSGRPLSFQPLPDFSNVLDDADEFDVAVGVAVAALAPRAHVHGRSSKAIQGLAVLRQALTYFARHGGRDLAGYIDLLSDPPPGVSSIPSAGKLAADMAAMLAASIVNDPLFGGAGAPVDPGALLTPEQGKRARVSVISFVGLPEDAQRQSFVNRLQMALFAWIKSNPARDRPLSGLLVIDEAQTYAPSGAMTPCSESTLALVSQARKYGLGLVFATQAPKALHNRIPGNVSTLFIGRMNSPAMIDAATEIARARGSELPGLGRLPAGQFFAATDDSSFRLVRVPMSLSHHPPGPLTTEEVMIRARPGP